MSGKNSSKGGNKKKKRYKLRYDRVIAVGVVLIVLIVMLVSCIGSCSNSDSSSQSISKEVLESSSSDSSASSDFSDDTTENTVQNGVEFTSVNLEYADINKGDLILVNKTYEYKFTEDLNITDIFSNRNDYYTVSDMDVLLENNVIYQLNQLMEAYSLANDNLDMRIIQGYRTKEQQEELYSSGSTDIKGGYSDLNTARSFYIGTFPSDGSSYYILNEGVYSWIYENADKYGFILRYPEGKDNVTGMESSTYTFRYVGVPHAIYMSQNNLTLEEYIQTIKSYTKDEPLKVTDGSTNYEVYYVTANVNNVTEVPVPSNQIYSISGNNVDGFIVTVTLS